MLSSATVNEVGKDLDIGRFQSESSMMGRAGAITMSSLTDGRWQRRSRINRSGPHIFVIFIQGAGEGRSTIV